MLSQTRLMMLITGLVFAGLVGMSFVSAENRDSLKASAADNKKISQEDSFLDPSLKPENSTGEDSEEVYLPYVQVFFDPLVKSLLTAQVSAPIVSINKRMGSSFNPNETLINLYDEVYKASVKKAVGLLKKAQIGLDAKKALFEDGVASVFDVADFEAAVAAAKSDLASASYLYDCCTIDVPYSGYVAAVLVNDFETPQVGQPLIEVVDTRIMLAKMLFDSTYIDRIFVGQKIKIEVKEINETVDGTVLRIAPVIDPASAKFKVEAEVKNIGSKIKPGMSGKIALKNLKVTPSEIPYGGSVQ